MARRALRPPGHDVSGSRDQLQGAGLLGPVIEGAGEALTA